MTLYRQVTVCMVCDKEFANKEAHKMCYFQAKMAYFWLRKKGFRKTDMVASHLRDAQIDALD